jgi:hypothetical protein
MNNLETQYDQAVAQAALFDTANAAYYAKQAINGRVIYAGQNALGVFNMPTIDFGSSGTVIAFGRGAMGKVPDARDSIAIGDLVMENTTITRDNIGIGSRALRNVQGTTIYYDASQQTGTRNVGIGSNTLLFTKEGYAHTAVGRNAGGCVVQGTGLTAIGYNAVAGYAPIGLTGDQENWAAFGTGSNIIYTTAVGYRSLETNTSNTSVAVGGYALNSNKRSEGNTAMGALALSSLDNITGNQGGTVTTLNISAAYSWSPTVLTITTASAHTLAVGDTAYIRLLDGTAATFSTDQAPGVVASVPNSTTFTINAPIYPATLSSAVGNAMLYSKESAAQVAQAGNNTAVGYQAGAAAVSGTRNVIIGAQAALSTAVPAAITAVGSQAFQGSTSASNSVGLGYYAAGNMSADATQVTAIGSQSMRNRIDGAPMTDAFTNIAALGAFTSVSASNQVQLGNSSTTTYVYGTVQNRSDERDKADITDTELGLDFVNKLRPVQYRWDMREDYMTYDEDGNATGLAERDGSKKRTRFHQGLIAQEVQAVVEEIGTDFGGLQDHSKSEGGLDVMSIGYDEMIAPLIKAVQELSAEIVELKAKLAAKDA